MTIQRGVNDTLIGVQDDAEHPLVSVVIPTHGRSELVRETVQAVVAQTYAGEIECLVVHDRERPDSSLAKLSAPRRLVRVTTNAHVPGLAGARNTGIDETTGSLIASCDDDDVWHPDKLAHQVARMVEDPELMVVGTGLRLLFPSRVFDWPARAEVIDHSVILRNRVKELHSSTMLIRRKLIETAGGYDEDLPNGYAEDYDFLLRAAAVGKVGCVIQPLCDIRKNGESFYLGKAKTTAAGLEFLLRKHPEIKASRRGHARLLGHIAWARSTAGDHRVAFQYVFRALRTWPAAPYAYLALLHLLTRVPPPRVLTVARLFGRGIT